MKKHPFLDARELPAMERSGQGLFLTPCKVKTSASLLAATYMLENQNGYIYNDDKEAIP